jgi:hypothetical protein
VASGRRQATGPEDARWRELLAEIVRAPNGGETMVAVLRCLLEVGQTRREHLQVLSRSLGPRIDESYMTVG